MADRGPWLVAVRLGRFAAAVGPLRELRGPAEGRGAFCGQGDLQAFGIWHLVEDELTKATSKNRGSTPDEASNDWRTDPRLIRALERHLGVHFLADMACTFANAVRPIYFTEDDDTLAMTAQDIAARIRRGVPGLDPNIHALFCNPPYSGRQGLEPWMYKARHVAAVSTLPWVMLLPASRTEQDFFHAQPAKTYHLTYLKDRADYYRPDGTPGGAPNHPSFCITFPGRNQRIIPGTFSHLDWKAAA